MVIVFLYVENKALFHWQFFHRIQIRWKFGFTLISILIATIFCTWHDSCVVVACAKICCDLMAGNGITARRNFHRIWFAGKKSLVKRAPGHTTNPPSPPNVTFGSSDMLIYIGVFSIKNRNVKLVHLFSFDILSFVHKLRPCLPQNIIA